MIIDFKLGQGSIVLRVKIRDSSVTTGAGLTGLTSASSGLIISTIADNEASATVYTVAASHVQTITTLGTFAAPSASNCRFKEVDATNHPGIYEIQIADARYAVSSAKSLLVSVSGATNMVQTDALVPLRSVDPYSATAFITGVNSLAPPSNWNLMTVDASGRVDVGKILGTANQGAAGYVALDMAQALPASPSAGAVGEALFFALNRLGRRGTAQAGGASTITLDSGASATDNIYSTHSIRITSGTGSGQVATITGYVGSTKVATITRPGGGTWTTNPDATSVFQIEAVPLSNVGFFLHTLLTETSGLLAAGFKKFFNVATPTGTVNSLPDAVAGASSGLALVGSNMGTVSGGTITTYTGNTPQTGDAYARLGAPAGASVSADVAAVQAKTTNLPGAPASTTNITGGTITTVTNLTNAPTAGDLTATMKSSVTAAVPTAANIRDVDNTSPAAGSLGAKVNSAASAGDPWATAVPGAYASGTAGNIVGNRIDAAISSRTKPADTQAAVTTVTNLTNAPTAGDLTAAMKTSLNASTPASVQNISAQTGDSYARLGAPAGASHAADVAAVKAVLPSALVSGRIDASVGAMAADTLTSSALAASAATEIAAAVLAASVESGVSVQQMLEAIGAATAGNYVDSTGTFKAVGNSGTTRLTTVLAANNRTNTPSL